MATDQELINSYCAQMSFDNRAKTTIYIRRTYLTKFAAEVGFSEATEDNIRQWLSRPSLQPQSRAIWLTTLHCFYSFANERGYYERVQDLRGNWVDFDPTAGIKKPKGHKGHPHPIPDSDLTEALKYADPLMRCWLLIGALCGARCQEIALVRSQDVHQNDLEPWLNIEFGKGNKSRPVPLHQDVINALNALPMRNDDGFLWDITPQQISKKINGHLHDLGIKSTAHSLRHWFGTNAYRNSMDLQLVADMMGHSNTAITSVYAAADQRKAAGVVGSLKIS